MGCNGLKTPKQKLFLPNCMPYIHTILCKFALFTTQTTLNLWYNPNFLPRTSADKSIPFQSFSSSSKIMIFHFTWGQRVLNEYQYSGRWIPLSVWNRTRDSGVLTVWKGVSVKGRAGFRRERPWLVGLRSGSERPPHASQCLDVAAAAAAAASMIAVASIATQRQSGSIALLVDTRDSQVLLQSSLPRLRVSPLLSSSPSTPGITSLADTHHHLSLFLDDPTFLLSLASHLLTLLALLGPVLA